MKTPEYREGPKALQDFKQGMIALFKVPKEQVKRLEKQAKPATSRKTKKADKD